MAVKNYKRYKASKKNIRLSLNKRNLANIRRFKPYLSWLSLSTTKPTKELYSVKARYRLLVKKAYGDLKDIKIKENNKIERRLDVLVFRLKWAHSIYHARQFIEHGWILLNGIKITNASTTVTRGDTISVKPHPYSVGQALNTYYKYLILYKHLRKLPMNFYNLPKFLSFRPMSLSVTLIHFHDAEFHLRLLNKSNEPTLIPK